MNAKYILYVIHENGEGYKVVGIKESADIFDFISRKHDKVLGKRGIVDISGDIHHMDNFIVVDNDYEPNFEEKAEWETKNV
jgi:hypothetical protein